MQVLVVDDDLVSRRFIAETLVMAGFSVTAVQDGAEALNLLEGGEFSIVITDWKMPKINGVTLCSEIRRRETNTKYIYVIMITSCNDREDVLRGLQAGVDDYITKPFDMTELTLRAKAAERTVERDTRAATLFALSKFIEMRSVESCGHLDRVSAYTRMLAVEMSTNPKYADIIDSEYIESISHASWMHDVGKTAIPNRLLLKRGPLTDEERLVMQTHTTIAAEAFDATIANYCNVPFLRYASEIARSHHEHYDGNGYPQSLSGDQIPLSARIVAVADVYDALRSRRVYKDALPHDEAKSFISHRAGSQFDPDVVNAFIAISDKLEEVRARYPDWESEEQYRGSMDNMCPAPLPQAGVGLSIPDPCHELS